MTLVKRLEVLGKYALAFAAGVMLFRPWRRRAAQRALREARRILLVRIDNRVGEALLMTPLLTTLKNLEPPPEVDVLVHPKAARVLEGHPAVRRVLPFSGRRLWLGPWAAGIRLIRKARYDVIVNCGNWTEPSVTSALVSRLCGPHAAVIGPAVWPLKPLHSHPVQPLPQSRSEVVQRVHLLTPIGKVQPFHRLSFRPTSAGPAFDGNPLAVVNPGGRLGWRRIPPEAFAAACRALVAAGITPWVTWGPGEEALAREVSGAVPGARLAPATTLDELASWMRAAVLTVCNNTGPMHLSVAVGTPTLGLFLHMEVDRWGHAHAPHRMLDLTTASKEGRDLPQEVFTAVADFVRATNGIARAHERTRSV